MVDLKKYNGTAWVDTTLRQYKTATADIEPTIYTDGTAITAYTIKGNTVQNGTPSPQNPVDVNGVGVRTEQLFDCLAKNANNGYINDMRLNGTTVESAPTNYISEYIRVNAETTYTISGLPTTNNYNTSLAFYDNSYTVIDAVKYLNRNSFNFTTPLNTAFIRISVFNEIERGVMLNTGSTAKPFEPYGYKIPISNGQQTIDIYIGDLPLLKSLDGTAVDDISNGTLTRRVDSDGSVLPTPTTTQITMPSIPTTQGANSITVDTTVQPSEFTATWTGWHNASVKEWDGSQWNE